MNTFRWARLIARVVMTVLSIFATGAYAANLVTYYYTDPLGTVLATADATGNLSHSNDYRPFGLSSDPQPQSAPGYTGHVDDTETQLVYMQARYYDPSIGRFLSIDSDPRHAGNALDFGRFTYVRNAPIGHSDPSGRCLDGCIVEAAIIVALAGAIAVEAHIILKNMRDNPAYVTPAVDPAVDGTISQHSDKPVITDREPGSDGKRGSTGGPGAGKRFRPETDEQKAEKEGVPCVYCGVPTTNTPGQPNSRERDHIDPKSRGGNNDPENDRDSCRTCNRQKGGKNPDEWTPDPQATTGG